MAAHCERVGSVKPCRDWVSDGKSLLVLSIAIPQAAGGDRVFNPPRARGATRRTSCFTAAYTNGAMEMLRVGVDSDLKLTCYIV